MGALHRKLHEQRGASMLMALFLLLVALMVSGVVLPSRNLACLSMALNSASFRVLALVSVAA